MQNKLAKVGVIELICDIIMTSKIEILKEECLFLAVALLVGGNQYTQNKFHDKIKDDHKNEFL